MRPDRREPATLRDLQAGVGDSIGPVPLLRLRGRYTFTNGVFIGTEVDGFGLKLPSFSEGGGTITGVVADGSVRAGLALTPGLDVFLSLRYIGGGAELDEQRPESPQRVQTSNDGYVANWLHTLTASVGITVK